MRAGSPGGAGWGRNLATLAIFGCLSAAFSWPQVLDPFSSTVSVHFDYYTMLWVASAVREPMVGLETSLAAWPLGQGMHRVDSVLFALVAWLIRIGPGALGAAFVLLGPVLSAWAAERVAARLFGARWPWSIIAGVAYGFSGLAATAVLEGHAYVLFNPWLPLMVEASWRALQRGGAIGHGLLAVLYWLLCLLTTAYAGINATLALLAVGLLLLAKRRLAVRGALTVGLGTLAAGLSYVVIFTQGSLARREESFHVAPVRSVLEAASATPPNLMAWGPSVDFVSHSMGPVVPYTALALALFAPVVLRWRSLAIPVLGFALLALALSMGPTLAFSPETGIPWLLAPLVWFEDAGWFFRFPCRLAHLSSLGFGLVGAAVASTLARARPRLALPVLALVVADLFVGTRLPARTGHVDLSVPGAYGAIDDRRALLELTPLYTGDSRDLSIYMQNLFCMYQHGHGAPLVNPCLGTTISTGPEAHVRAWLLEILMEPDGGYAPPLPALGPSLAELGIGWVSYRPILHTEGDRHRLEEGLRCALGPPVAESRDAGDHLMVFRVDEAPGPDPVGAFWRLVDTGSLTPLALGGLP